MGIRPGAKTWPFLVFAFVSIGLCWELLLPGRVLMPTSPYRALPWSTTAPENIRSNNLMSDGLILTYPSRLYTHEMLRSGQIPFWNPRIFSGYPHLAMIQNNTLYPFTLPFDLIAPVAGIGLSIALHLALAGALMFLFLRHIGVSVHAGIIGGLAFELNGMFLIRQCVPSYVFSAVWLPLILLGIERLVRGRTMRQGWPIAVGVALSVLGGHPQITSLVLLLASAYTVFRVLSGDVVSCLGSFTKCIGLIVIGVGLSGFQLLPFLELAMNVVRDKMPVDVYRSAAVPVVALFQAFVPDVFGHPITDTYWFGDSVSLLDGPGAEPRYWGLNYSGENLFTGVCPVILAAVALFRSRRPAEMTFFAMSAIIALGILFGTPLLDLAYWCIPLFKYSRPDRIILIYMVAVAVLAAFGYEALETTRERKAVRRHSHYLLLAASGTILVAIFWPFIIDPQRRTGLDEWFAFALTAWSRNLRDLGPQLAFTAAVGLVSAVLLLPRVTRAPRALRLSIWVLIIVIPNALFAWRFNPVQRDLPIGKSATEVYLRTYLGHGRIARIYSTGGLYYPANVPQIDGIFDVNGASAAGLTNYIRLVRAFDPGGVKKDKYFDSFTDSSVADSHLLQLLNVKFVLSQEPLDMPLAFSGDQVGVYWIFNGLPRFFVVPSLETYTTVEDALLRLRSPDFNARLTVLVPEGSIDARPSSLPNTFGTARIDSYTAHDISITVKSPGGGVLVSSEVFYPGWVTEIDGHAVDTLLVNTTFRGARLSPGRHHVRMRYVPRSFYAGTALSVLSLLLLVVVIRRSGQGSSSS